MGTITGIAAIGAGLAAIGAGIGSDVRTEVNYIPEKVSHLITSMLSLGAVEIDGDAARVQLCTE